MIYSENNCDVFCPVDSSTASVCNTHASLTYFCGWKCKEIFQTTPHCPKASFRNTWDDIFAWINFAWWLEHVEINYKKYLNISALWGFQHCGIVHFDNVYILYICYSQENHVCPSLFMDLLSSKKNEYRAWIWACITIAALYCTIAALYCRSLHFIVLSLPCIVLKIHCIVLTIHCIVLTIHCIVDRYIVLYKRYIILYCRYIVLYRRYIILYKRYIVL